tara:strand:- start:394 stop:909 length:516 start_codon:yes stop_codon:yes gene_type:complete
MKILKFIPFIAFIFLTIFLFKKINNFEESKNLSSALIDKPFPDLDLNNLDGGKRLKDIIGKKNLIINYFASWCAPCRLEHETLTIFKKDHNIIGIAYKDERKNITKFLKELGNPYREVFLDRNGRSAIDLGLYGVPETYFVDRRGFIRYKHVGPIDEDEFKKIINILNQKL